MDQQPSTPKPHGSIIKNIYLYLVSFVALMMIVFSTADVVNITLKAFIFTKADEVNYSYYPACVPATPVGTSTVKTDPNCVSPDEQKKRDEESRSAQRQSSLVRDLSMIVVGIPVFLYHWNIVRRKDEV